MTKLRTFINWCIEEDLITKNPFRGYVETPAEIDHLLALTDPSLVGLVLDMGHYKFGGGDPLTALQKHENRIWHVHFKDCHPEIALKSKTEGWDYFQSVGKGVFCELGIEGK
jgi:inosose dehydratase